MDFSYYNPKSDIVLRSLLESSSSNDDLHISNLALIDSSGVLKFVLIPSSPNTPELPLSSENK